MALMTRKRILAGFGVIVVLAVVVRLAAHSGTTPRRATTSTASTNGWTPIRPGAPNTPRSVLYRFANTFGALSNTTVAERYKVLTSLAAPPLLSELRAAGSNGELSAIATSQRRTRINSLLLSLKLTARSDTAAHGTVVIEQWLVGPGEAQVPPMRSSYVADLVEVGGAWHVSGFTLVP
jgi:hypothetical protein